MYLTDNSENFNNKIVTVKVYWGWLNINWLQIILLGEKE